MNLHRSILSLGIALSALAISAAPLKAQAPKQPSTPLIDFANGGTLVNGNTLSEVTSTGWNQLNTYSGNTRVLVNSGSPRPYGAHSDTSAWNSTIASNLGTGSGQLWKSGGYGYIASSSLHQGVGSNDFGPGGNFELTLSSIGGLQTVIFQIQATNRIDGNNKFVFNSLPTISFGEYILAADFGGGFARENGFSAGFGGQDMDSYAFQWDLSGYEITGDFKINWGGVANSGIFTLQVDQSDSFAQVVPEPTSIALLVAGAGALLWRRKFRRAA